MVSDQALVKKMTDVAARASRAPLTVGIDVGTTSVKCGVINEMGETISSFFESYPKSLPQRDWVEQDPENWLRIIFGALSTFEREVGLHNIGAICLCSQVNTHVFVGSENEALAPAIVWSDTRCKSDAAELNDSFSEKEKLDIWGFDFVIDSSFALSRAIWMAQNRPDIWRKTKWIMSPKDFCNLALCGQPGSDAFSSVGLAKPNGDYVVGLDNWLPGFSTRLPPLKDMFEPVGRTALPEFPSLDATVFTGTMDAWANVIGSGVVEPGFGALITGTSSIVGIMSEHAHPAKGIITFPPFQGYLLHAGPTQAGSDALAWFAKSVGRNITDLLDGLSTRKLSRSSPIFLPHLQGERAPLWDPNARGTFVGLSHHHDALDMGLAVVEGVAYSERHLFEECCKAAGFTPRALRFSGGSSQNDFWAQLRSDVLGISLERLRMRDSGVLGAAVIASVGSDKSDSLQEAAGRLAGIKDAFEPRRFEKKLLDIRYGYYRTAYRQLKSLFDEMALDQ